MDRTLPPLSKDDIATILGDNPSYEELLDDNKTLRKLLSEAHTALQAIKNLVNMTLGD